MKDFLKRNKIALILLACAFLLLAVGLYKEQTSAVLSKAARICMECVGLG